MKRLTVFLAAVILILSACGQGAFSEGTSGFVVGLSWQEQYDLGIRYLSEGNYEEAIIAFTAAIEIDPKQALAYVGRGQAHLLIGGTESHYDAAQSDFEQAIELNNSIENAWIGLANVFVARGDQEQAALILEQARGVLGDIPAIVDYLDAIQREFENLVTDAYRVDEKWGNFAIPQININSYDAKTINAEIWDNIYNDVITDIEDLENNGYDVFGESTYQWSQNGNILSIWIECDPHIHITSNPYYYIYNLSIPEGKLLSSKDILKYYNLTERDYREKVNQALYSFHFECYGDSVYNSYDQENITLANHALEETLSDTNITNSNLFINSEGELSIAAYVYSIAGADCYEHIISLENYDLPEHYPDGYKRGIEKNADSYITAVENCMYKCNYSTLNEWDKNACRGLLYDLNGDGQEELILRYVSDYAVVFEVWSRVSGRIVCVNESPEMWGGSNCIITLVEGRDFNQLVYSSILGGSGGDTAEWHVYSTAENPYQLTYDLLEERIWGDESESEEYRIDGEVVSKVYYNQIISNINNGIELMKMGTQTEGMALPDLLQLFQINF